ncbi:hypothetical protein QNH46_18640 [Paenibacillus woosongensis]|uniref:Uncharacterized protein n=1 Tax=Paenibacillus woosongensis TaxID=307580 RepID=A0AA95I202_9BACL|nr:hypothetical protein [Paenibacillus woosongensis]WHX48111.1 hypothetical protein QNH46_18640 [Paenibacillus woosongensis]
MDISKEEGTQGLYGGEGLKEGAAMTEAKIKAVHRALGSLNNLSLVFPGG